MTTDSWSAKPTERRNDMQLILTGETTRDMEVLLVINKALPISFGGVIVGAKPRHSSHHKARLRKAYDSWSAPIRQWNRHDHHQLTSPYRREFVVGVG